MTRLHTYSSSQLRIRAVQGVIYAIVFALGTLVMYLILPPEWQWGCMGYAAACLWTLVDAARALAIIQRRKQ